MRALLDLVRDNEATIDNVSTSYFRHILYDACMHLTILDPDVGDEELIKAVETELTRLDPLWDYESESEIDGESES